MRSWLDPALVDTGLDSRAATFEKLATDDSLRIAWSKLLPTAVADASYTQVRQDIKSSDNAVFAVGDSSFPTKTYGVQVSQPLFRITDWVGVSQARAEVKQAAAELDTAYQDLVFRVADAYLGVLVSQDELTIRTLIGVCPGLDDADVPYWVIEPSKVQREAHHLVTVAYHLRQRIEQYLAVLDVNRRTGEARFEDDLPF